MAFQQQHYKHLYQLKIVIESTYLAVQDLVLELKIFQKLNQDKSTL